MQEQDIFPTGGWGFQWVGHPDRGFKKLQPGGWMYNLLPYIDQQALHDLGAGGNGLAAASAQRIQTPLSYGMCPSRRRVEAVAPGSFAPPFRPTTNAVTKVARSDFAMNGGEQFIGNGGGPADLPSGDNPNYAWPDVSAATGLSYVRSEIRLAHVTDGATNTYLVGEKYLNPDHYFDGVDWGDNESMYGGDDQDILRWSAKGYPPAQDSPGAGLGGNWGSSHPGSFNISMCDGSVRSISYFIDLETHRRLGNRKDGQPVDASKMQ